VRRAIPFAILAGCLGVGVLPALAADGTVAIHDFSFDPSRIAVMPGDSVTWQAEGTAAMHNVHFNGDIAPVGAASTNFNGTRQFPDAGTFRYHCDVHASMTGTVFVNATGTVPTPSPTASPTASPTVSPTTSPYPTASPAPGGGTATPPPGPTATGGSGATVTSFRARAARSRFCTTRSASCKKPGVFLLVDLGASEPVRVRGTLKRGSKRVRAVSLRVRPGKRRVRLPGPRLKPGRYVLTLRAGDIKRTLRFRVSRVHK
jgi:hypothetical protein